MTQAEIEAELRKILPALFGQPDEVHERSIAEKTNALNEFGKGFAQPSLQPDTLRYQTLLISASFLLLVITFFRIQAVKILPGVRDVRADFNFLLAATTACVAIAVVFVLKAYIDVQRASFVRHNGAKLVLDAQERILIGAHVFSIQMHYGQLFSDAVSRAHWTYAVACGRLGDRTVGEPILLGTKLDESVRTHSALKSYCDEIHLRLSLLLAELDRDVSRFKTGADRLQPTPVVDQDVDFMNRRKATALVTTLYEETLDPWVRASGALASDHLSSIRQRSTPSQQLEGILTILMRMRRIGRVYPMVEVAGPIVFMVAAIGYTWFDLVKG